MGLDQWLTAKQFIWGKDEEKITISGLKNEIPDGFKIKGIECEAIYWRKANAIHKWFVDNVQDGEDNCGTYLVDSDDLKKLLKLVDEALDSKGKAKEILPITGGFFFGGTDYDEWYWKDLERTKVELGKVLKVFNDSSWEFYYHSSW